MNTPALFQLQIPGPWLNVMQVKCHTGSICSQHAKCAPGEICCQGQSQGRLCSSKKGGREEVLFFPVPNGQIHKLSGKKLKELIRGTLN